MLERNSISSYSNFLNTQSIFTLYLKETWTAKESKAGYKIFFNLNFKLTKAIDMEWERTPQSNFLVAPREYMWHRFISGIISKLRLFYSIVKLLQSSLVPLSPKAPIKRLQSDTYCMNTADLQPLPSLWGKRKALMFPKGVVLKGA